MHRFLATTRPQAAWPSLVVPTTCTDVLRHRLRAVLGRVGLLLGALLAGCGPSAPAPNAANPAPANPGASAPVAGTTGGNSAAPVKSSPPPSGPPIFVERATELGIDFEQFNGMSGEFYFCEIVGTGAAFFDYDNDGDMDLYIAQGGMLGGKPMSSAILPTQYAHPSTDRLYRNELVESGSLRFTDVTESSGIVSKGYGMGVAAADYDNDGFVDLYVSNFDENQFFRNLGNGRFEDVTAKTGTEEKRWSTSVAFFDYDADGFLDLYVCNYVDFNCAQNKACYSSTSARDYCGPLSYSAYPDLLFRNRGDGTFENRSALTGIARDFGSALGLACTDFNGDGYLDVFIANDGRENQLWINQTDGTFSNEAIFGGVAFNMDGVAEASMGVDAADFDGDGDFDLFMTHLTDETNTYYANDGSGIFEDLSAKVGLGIPSRRFTGFGTAAIDYDNDGWLVLHTANGAVVTIEEQARAGDPFPLHQTNQLFRNVGGGRFQEVSESAGPAFDLSEVSRGAAFADVDNDGDMDALIVNNNGPARLLINEVGNKKAWVRFRVVDPSGKYDLLGARLDVSASDGQRRMRRVRTEASYCSSNDPRVLVGLGDSSGTVDVTVHYVGGGSEYWKGLAIRKSHTLTRGSGDK